MRTIFYVGVGLALAVTVMLAQRQPLFWALAVAVLSVGLIGAHDLSQRRHAILRNFPVIGHFRYLLEKVRPEINQYFIESNLDGTPFNREDRSVVYQRAKGVRDTVAFGTQQDVYAVGYEWISHSILAQHAAKDVPRVLIGEGGARPYEAALLSVSAMSFGSLSSHAVEALSRGARAGGFALNTGEGGVSKYHLAGGADLVWQIGTGYFGCRGLDGGFDLARYRETVAIDAIKMVELKLSQGAKPGHGGILPSAKLTAEIAEIRGVPLGADVLSPPAHSAFETPVELLEFIDLLRRESGGRPVGIKLCVGQDWEFMALCKAMRATGLVPDFISVDGGEGGTGAAPLEFSNRVGSPMVEGLILVHGALVGFGLRERVRLIASGKITTGFDMARALALGADLCASARGMMLALGCIQARACNSNTCPTGVATQDGRLVSGLDVRDKSGRVEAFQRETVQALLELLAAAGLSGPGDLGPLHINRRVSTTRVCTYQDIYSWPQRGALLQEPIPASHETAWRQASPDSFRPVV